MTKQQERKPYKHKAVIVKKPKKKKVTENLDYFTKKRLDSFFGL